MMRILKALNGSFNTQIAPFEWYRLGRKRVILKNAKKYKMTLKTEVSFWITSLLTGASLQMRHSPLPLIKSSLAATFSREAANFMSKSEVVQEQFRFLKGTYCADESFWGTIAGHPHLLPMPGGFDARNFLQREYGGARRRRIHGDPWTAPPIAKSWNATTETVIDSYAISRHQQWVIETNSLCRGANY
ncbi:hypothetical protein COOONC_23205 [Cooperia oncophora]